METLANTTTLYCLPRSRLKAEGYQLHWIDDYDSITVDADFCIWLAEYYELPSPLTDEIIVTDFDASFDLYRWNSSFACTITGGDPDMFDGMIGGNSPTEPVACYDTWMTQRQAWHMREFFRSSLQDAHVVVELRLR